MTVDWQHVENPRHVFQIAPIALKTHQAGCSWFIKWEHFEAAFLYSKQKRKMLFFVCKEFDTSDLK